jgi:hypothetical protein
MKSFLAGLGDIVDHSRERVRSTIANMRKKGGGLGRTSTGTLRDL